MSVLLEMRGIEKRYGGVRALSGVDFEVDAGEVHALLGENGAGKSTLMKVLSGAIAPDGGSASLGGAPYRPTGPLAAESLGVAMIYQERSLCPDLSVVENILLGHEPASFGVVERTRAASDAERALARLGHAELTSVRRVSALGPGERQVVEIARALSRSARLIVMDEPTSSLSGADAARLLDIVQKLRSEGTSIVYISHFLEEVAKVADRYTVLRDGRTVATGSMASARRSELLEQMAGRQLTEAVAAPQIATGETVLELEGVRARGAQGRTTLSLRRGEILGIAGLLGAGRTELLRAVFGLDPLAEGRVCVAAVWDHGQKPWERLRRRVGLLSEDRSGEGLALGMSIAENLTLSHLERVSTFGLVDRRAQGARVTRWAESLGIKAHSADAPVSSLSGGNQQKVALARLLDLDVDVLLLDEPTRGVDAVTKESIYGLLGDLAARGKAIVFVSSYVPELLAVCNRIAVMHRGVLSPPRATSEWTEESILDVATRGTAA